jgi:hypothetical protein
MTDEKWMHLLKEGREIRLGIYEGEHKNTQELIATLDKEIDKLQTGIFLTVNEKTKETLAVFITKDTRRGMDEHKADCLGTFKKGELKGEAEFRQAKGRVIGTAKINTGVLGEVMEGKEFTKMVKNAFEGVRDRTIKDLEKKGYTKGKIGP